MLFKADYKIWQDNSDNFQKATGISKTRQIFDLFYYKMIGFSPRSYYTIPIPLERQRKELISDKTYHLFERSLNDRCHGVVPFDKWIQSCFWKANGFPHARTYGFIKNNCGTLCGRSVDFTSDEFMAFLETATLPMVIKPLNAANGFGFDVVKSFDHEASLIETLKMGLVDFKTFKHNLFGTSGKDEGYLFQEYISQHEELKMVFPGSVNTLRVVTHVGEKKDLSVVSALMKFGAGKAITDNDNYGGRVFSFMGIENGTLGKAFTSSTDLKGLEKHPDTNMQISGYVVPFWKEAMELALKAHAILPYPRHVGWDIAITNTGPIIIELNSFLAISMYQKFGTDLLGTTAFGRSFSQYK